MSQEIQRLPTVLKTRGRSRSSHYQDIDQGLYTHPVQIGLRAVGWPDDEVAALNAARIAGKSDEEIRALVVQLEAARKNPQQADLLAAGRASAKVAQGHPARTGGKRDQEIHALVKKLAAACNRHGKEQS